MSHCRKGEGKMKAEAKMNIEEYLRTIKTAVDHIAFVRRLAEMDGHDVAYIDEQMNKMCEKYHAMYAEMTEPELAAKAMIDMIALERMERMERN